MASLLSSLGIATAVIVVVLVVRRWNPSAQVQPPLAISASPNLISKKLAAALPESVILPGDKVAFTKSINTYFTQQEREVAHAGIVQPRDVDEVATAIKILKKEYDKRQPQQTTDDVLFAVRGGGQSPTAGGASAKGGVLIDLSLFREVSISEDRESVVLGAGCNWAEVSRILDDEGLAVVGGRSAEVGVAGYTLGGGISFYTPRFGLACSNTLAYEVVLASGEIVTATASSHPDLWRALQGGSNNFGVVTRFTVRCFPSTNIWSGFLFAPGFQSTKALIALHESANRADPKVSGSGVDLDAASAIACFTYLQAVGIQVVTVHLAHTRPIEGSKAWPSYWKTSGFATLWRLWSTFKIQMMTSAVIEMGNTSPTGQRGSYATTTIKNDLPTIMAVYAVHQEAIASMRQIKGLEWTIVLQPLLPSWVAKGSPNTLGVHQTTDDALLIICYTVHWRLPQDDKYVYTKIRETIEKIDAVAQGRGTDHPYRYLNYCMEGQRPLEGYGQANLRFLRDVSKHYDPDGLFQKGCTGGFKLEAKT